MTLYTKKKGKFVPLEKAQIRRLRRHEEVIQMQQVAGSAAASLLALSAWLHSLNLRSRKLTNEDLVVTRTPGPQLLAAQAAALMECKQKLMER